MSRANKGTLYSLLLAADDDDITGNNTGC